MRVALERAYHQALQYVAGLLTHVHIQHIVAGDQATLLCSAAGEVWRWGGAEVSQISLIKARGHLLSLARPSPSAEPHVWPRVVLLSSTASSPGPFAGSTEKRKVDTTRRVTAHEEIPSLFAHENCTVLCNDGGGIVWDRVRREMGNDPDGKSLCRLVRVCVAMREECIAAGDGMGNAVLEVRSDGVTGAVAATVSMKPLAHRLPRAPHRASSRSGAEEEAHDEVSNWDGEGWRVRVLWMAWDGHDVPDTLVLRLRGTTERCLFAWLELL